ncbi:unnamed protein product [Auanema sp. JU1783]|nr:unnamed protein product [Auanema sp. JU1783]
MPWICCAHKSRRSKREDQYKVKENSSNTQETQFSWDKRELSNVANLIMKDVANGIELRKDFNGDPAVIENCKESTIIVLSHTASINIDDCRDCLIVLGPCTGSVFVRDCESCTILTICQQFRTRDCHGLKVSIRCMSEPIIEQSDDITVYPLTYFYEGLKGDLEKSGLRPFYNQAVSVHDFTPEKGNPHFKVLTEILELSKKEEDDLKVHGVRNSKHYTLFPLPAVHGCSTTLSYMGKAADFSNLNYEECRQKLLDDIEVTSKMIVGCVYDVDLSEKDYSELGIPINDITRLTIIGIVGDEMEFKKIIRRHPLFKLIPKDSGNELVAAMRKTGICRTDPDEKDRS